MTPEKDVKSVAEPPPGSGRPVVLVPTPPGLMMVIGGAAIAGLGPLFGLLVGTMLGSTTKTEDLDPIALFLILGIVIGGLGVLLALFGAHRLYRSNQAAADRDKE